MNKLKITLSILLMVMAGCANNQTVSREKERLLAEQRDKQIKEVAHALEAGRVSYEEGQYAEAEKWLFSEKIWMHGTAEDKSNALKILAFGFCINNLEITCVQAFERAFIINPDFELSAAERGHPLWDPAFQRANFTYKCLAAKRLENGAEKATLCQ